MGYYFVVEAIPFLFASLLSAFMCLYLILWYAKTKSVVFYTLILAAVSLWSFSYAFEILATTKSETIFWINIQYLAIIGIPMLFLFFTLAFTSNDNVFKKPKYLILIIVPSVINYLFLISNDYHQLYYTLTPLEAPFIIFKHNFGILFTLNAFLAYCYTILGFSLLYISQKKRKDKQFTKKVLIIISGVCFPVFFNFLYIFNIFPFPYSIDFTSLAFSITIIIIFIGIHEFNLLGINLYQLTLNKFKYFGLVVTDLEHRILEINRKAEEYLLDNPGTKSYNGYHLFRLLYSQNNLKPYFKRIKIIEESLPQLVQSPQNSKAFELELLHPVQPKKEYISVIVETLDVRNKVLGFVYLINDISTIKEMQVILSRNNEFKSNLLRILSHDLNNKIMTIQGYIEMLKIKLEDNPKSTEIQTSIKAIESKINESAMIISDVKEYLKTLDMIGKKEPDLKLLDIRKILDSCIKSFKEEIKAKNLQIIEKIPYDTISTLADIRIRSVFSNLLENAIKWSPDYGTLEIVVSKKDRFWVFSFIDEGPGIEEENIGEIFKPFISFGPQAGSGLGLSIALEIAQSFKGTVWVENRTDKSGAIFHFEIPIVESQYSI
ncbi:MAG: sensor histidine kinase [Candidatus Hodarchaeales archaeon]